LLKSKNFGRKSYNELREILEERFNAKLKGDQ
jgi:DNA-directed RNA polymerase alpha subunit